MHLERAANERKLQLKSAIECQKQKAQNKMIEIAKTDESCVKIEEHAASVKRNVQQFADNIIAAIEAKKMEIFDDVENQVQESLEGLGMQRKEMEQQVQMHESAIKKTDTLLRRSTNVQILQPSAFLGKIFQKEGDQKGTADRDKESFLEYEFVKNQQLFNHVRAEQIGSFGRFLTKTRPQISSAEGKGISKATVGLEAQIVVTTRNSRGEQCYEEQDCVTVEIRNHQGHDCESKAQVQDNKDGTYKISYFAKETGVCPASVKINGEHVRGSPLEVQVKPREFKPVVGNKIIALQHNGFSR